MSSGVISINKATYQSNRIVRSYAREPSRLTAFEQFCLDRVPAKSRMSILDIGVGGGRTSRPLADMFAVYTGIDYAPRMIEAAIARHPDLDLRVMNASSLAFGEQFDVAMFSFNGIDYVDSATRFAIQREMMRVLRPGGYMIYSTHNLNYRRVATWQKSIWVRELGPRRPGDVLGMFNRIRNYFAARGADEYGIAFVNDPGERFGVVTAYIDIPHELVRLAAMGLEVETTIGNRKSTAGYDADDSWVYILARKR